VFNDPPTPQPYGKNVPFGDKWTTLIILLLDGRPRRFSELERSIQGISHKMLSQTLRDMERDGFVTRTVYPEVPPRVEYALTPLGKTLIAPITTLLAYQTRAPFARLVSRVPA